VTQILKRDMPITKETSALVNKTTISV